MSDEKACIERYLSLVTSQHKFAPRFMAVIELTVRPYCENQALLARMPELFDLDSAVGEQLDFTGQWIGLTRWVEIPADIWFSWAIAGLGWGEGVWRGRHDAPTAVRLDDEFYRRVLKTRVAANQWDGTKDGLYAAWRILFEPGGWQILIEENYQRPLGPESVPGARATGIMRMTLAVLGPPLDPVMLALWTGGYFDLKPAGVGIGGWLTQSVQGAPLFAWGLGPESPPAPYPPVTLAGWGMGGWAKQNTPVPRQPDEFSGET